MDIELSEISFAAIKSTNIRTANQKYEDDDEMLRASIKQRGLIYPILIRELKSEEKQAHNTKAKFGIIDGHRRYAAIKILANDDEKYKKIKCEVFISDEEKKIAFIANTVRKDLEELEKAEAVYTMHSIDDKSYRKIAGELTIGKSYAAKLGKMWEEHLRNENSLIKQKVVIQYDYAKTKVLADSVLKELANYSEIVDAEKKIGIKKNMEELISQLQSKLSEINKSEDVKVLIIKDRVGKIKRARADKKKEKVKATMQIVK